MVNIGQSSFHAGGLYRFSTIGSEIRKAGITGGTLLVLLGLESESEAKIGENSRLGTGTD